MQTDLTFETALEFKSKALPRSTWERENKNLRVFRTHKGINGSIQKNTCLRSLDFMPKWRTGIDAPPVHTLYVGKPMKWLADHWVLG